MSWNTPFQSRSFLRSVFLLIFLCGLVFGSRKYAQFNQDDDIDAQPSYIEEVNDNELPIDNIPNTKHVSNNQQPPPPIISMNIIIAVISSPKLLFALFIQFLLAYAILYVPPESNEEPIHKNPPPEDEDESADNETGENVSVEEKKEMINASQTQISVRTHFEEFCDPNKQLDLLIEDYYQKEISLGLTIEERSSLCSLLAKRKTVATKIELKEKQLLLQEEGNFIHAQQADAMQITARNSAEVLAFKRTQALFTFFEKYEVFVRYWSVCSMCCMWGFCKVRGLAPSTTTISLKGYAPWWLPSVMVPNLSFAAPVAIILSLVVVIVVIFVTQGNTIASFLIFMIFGLIFLWSVDSITIATGLFSLLRLFVFTVLLCAFTTILFKAISLSGKKGVLVKLIIFFLFFLCLVSACYLGYWVSITDFPNLPTGIEIRLLSRLDEFISTM